MLQNEVKIIKAVSNGLNILSCANFYTEILPWIALAHNN